jgi:hypothetical protein
MFYRVGVPLLILVVLALLLLAVVLWQRRRENTVRREERLAARNRWDGNCQFDNPTSGAKCEREEFHLEHHYHDVNGELVWW